MFKKWLFVFVIIIISTGIGILFTPKHPPVERSITIHARRYEYDPPIIKVNKGDKLTITLISEDVEHGFYLEGYGINESIKKLPPDEKPKQITFIAKKSGKFRYRCSKTCGYLHPFMQGELIIRPNYLYYGGIGLIVGILFSGLVLAFFHKN